MAISYTKLGRGVFPSISTLGSQTPPLSQTTTPPSDSPRMLLNCYQRSTFADPHATIYWSANMQPQVRTIFKLATLSGPGFVESHTG